MTNKIFLFHRIITWKIVTITIYVTHERFGLRRLNKERIKPSTSGICTMHKNIHISTLNEDKSADKNPQYTQAYIQKHNRTNRLGAITMYKVPTQLYQMTSSRTSTLEKDSVSSTSTSLAAGYQSRWLGNGRWNLRNAQF